MRRSDDVLIYAHIGDLHLTTEECENARDLNAIVDEIALELGDAVDFVYVPGDNADNGLPEQYDIASRALARLPMPVHIITGDHDMEPGGLDNFYRALDAAPLPKAVDAGGTRCLFLDICGPGSGGPDFRMGSRQTRWLDAELKDAAAKGQRCAVFMHTYPADLRGEGEAAALNEALSAREVLLVDMGHTHYNELANDGRTIFSATRSTGQIEEGPVGYSIVTIDKRTVSWRFKPLREPFPMVLITAPADRRLATDSSDPDHIAMTALDVRASVLGKDPVAHCTCRVDDGAETPMREIGPGRYALEIDRPRDARQLTVSASTSSGAVGRETIDLATSEHLAKQRHADGSDADTVGAWDERGILGNQLGPNRNGRQW